MLAFRFLVFGGLTIASNFGECCVIICLVPPDVSSCNLIAVCKSILRNVCHKRISCFSSGCSRNNHFFI